MEFMADFGDVPLRRDASNPLPPSHGDRRGAAVGILAVMLVIAAGVATYVLWFQGRSVRVSTDETTAQSVRAPTAVAQQPLGPQVEPVTLPPIDESDAFVRTRIEALSRRPLVLAFLRIPNLIRTVAAVGVNLADGGSLAPSLGSLRPKAPFATIERNGVEYIDPQAFERYAAFADAAHSIDAGDAAKLYATLKPLIDQAYHDLGFPSRSFDDVVKRDIVLLLRTPTTDTAIAVRPKGALWQYADDRLEQLSPAQKQLLRMGPANAGIIKDKIREIALALGMPPDSLPPPSR